MSVEFNREIFQSCVRVFTLYPKTYLIWYSKSEPAKHGLESFLSFVIFSKFYKISTKVIKLDIITVHAFVEFIIILFIVIIFILYQLHNWYTIIRFLKTYCNRLQSCLKVKYCHHCLFIKYVNHSGQSKLLQTLKINSFRTSNQDGGIGRHAFPPHATTKRITTGSQKK